MHQHLVDDHLEEQRRDQAEQLQEERRDQNFAQEMAIFVDRAKKPGDVEPARDLRQSSATRHQDQLAVPDGNQFVPCHQDGSGRHRRLNQDLVLVRLREHQKPAIAQGARWRARASWQVVTTGFDSPVPSAPGPWRTEASPVRQSCSYPAGAGSGRRRPRRPEDAATSQALRDQDRSASCFQFRCS